MSRYNKWSNFILYEIICVYFFFQYGTHFSRQRRKRTEICQSSDVYVRRRRMSELMTSRVTDMIHCDVTDGRIYGAMYPRYRRMKSVKLLWISDLFANTYNNVLEIVAFSLLHFCVLILWMPFFSKINCFVRIFI